MLGISLEELVTAEIKKTKTSKFKFPLVIEARHRGQTYSGAMLDIKGNIRWNGQEYTTPSGAAKAIATEWKEVNGWKFWKYENPSSGQWEYISNLREES